MKEISEASYFHLALMNSLNLFHRYDYVHVT